MSTPPAFSCGVRSVKAPVEHHLPTLLASKANATSGAVPALIACVTLSESCALTARTVMFGCALWNMSSTAFIAFTSWSAVNGCQKVIVTGLPS